jgi:hypothetical protein
MGEPRDGVEALERLRKAHSALDAALERVPAGAESRPGAAGEWSVKDIVAHIASDDRWFAAQLEAALEGVPPTPEECYGDATPPGPEFDFSTADGRNAWHYQRNRDLSWAEARKRLRANRERLLRALERVPAGEFGEAWTIEENGHTGCVRPAREVERPWAPAPLLGWLKGNGWGHYEEHAEQVRTLAERLNG